MKLIKSLAFLGLGVISNFTANALDAEKTQRILQFENEDVKVWKTILMPNDPLPMHAHNDKRILVALTDTSLKVTNDKGETKQYNWPKGTAHFLDVKDSSELHNDANESTEPMEVMVISLK